MFLLLSQQLTDVVVASFRCAGPSVCKHWSTLRELLRPEKKYCTHTCIYLQILYLHPYIPTNTVYTCKCGSSVCISNYFLCVWGNNFIQLVHKCKQRLFVFFFWQPALSLSLFLNSVSIQLYLTCFIDMGNIGYVYIAKAKVIKNMRNCKKRITKSVKVAELYKTAVKYVCIEQFVLQ